MNTDTPPNPGSDEAIALGCKCPVLDNRHGIGSNYGDGIFWIAEICPIHAQGQKDDTATSTEEETP
jgi:hypothetical protein